MKRILSFVWLLPCLAWADLRQPGILNNSAPQAGAVFNVSSGTVTNLTVSTASVTTLIVTTATITNQVGTTTNNNATVGSYGEYFSSSAANASLFPGTGTYGDIASIVLTPGDWDLAAVAYVTANGATVPQWDMGIGTVAGNSATGLVPGDSDVNALGPTTVADQSLSISSYRVSIAAGATYYLKIRGTFSVAVPKYYGRLSARRVR